MVKGKGVIFLSELFGINNIRWISEEINKNICLNIPKIIGLTQHVLITEKYLVNKTNQKFRSWPNQKLTRALESKSQV